jgi:transcriptional regulator of heat shock response
LKLYELSQNYVQLLELADSLDQETFQDTLSSLEEAIEDKAENMAKLIKCLDSDCKAIKEEEQRLADRRKALENKISSIKEYLQNQMEVAGLNKVKRPTITISIQANPPSVEVMDESLIPSTYMVPQPSKIDKRAILTALKEGEFIPGASIKKTMGVRIK